MLHILDLLFMSMLPSDWSYFVLPYNEDNNYHLDLNETYYIKKINKDRFEIISK